MPEMPEVENIVVVRKILKKRKVRKEDRTQNNEIEKQ